MTMSGWHDARTAGIDCFRDAADALAFGAELLKKASSVDEVYTLLRKAYALVQGKTC